MGGYLVSPVNSILSYFARIHCSLKTLWFKCRQKKKMFLVMPNTAQKKLVNISCSDTTWGSMGFDLAASNLLFLQPVVALLTCPPGSLFVFVTIKHFTMRTWASLFKEFQNSVMYSHTVIFLRPVVISWDGFLINSSGTSIAVGFHKLPGSKKKEDKKSAWLFTLIINLLSNWRQSLPPPAHPPRSPVLWIWPYWTGCGVCQSSSDTQTHRTCSLPILALGCIVGKIWEFKGLELKKNFAKVENCSFFIQGNKK